MKPKFTQDEFNSAKPNDKLSCECYQCNKIFTKTRHEIQRILNPKHSDKGMYCSSECSAKNRANKKIIFCKQCNKKIERIPANIKRTKNNFCSHSCSTIYSNSHKTFGYKRSKLEKYIEEQLIILYPSLIFDFNKTNTINSELDIYIPSLKLAFEINGIFHYEPVFGPEQLSKIQNNDQRKFQACIERGISFCTIDSSSLKHFKKDKADYFLQIIIDIINNKSKN